MTTATTVVPPAQSKVSALLYGTAWQLDSDNRLPYSFATASDGWEGYLPGSEPYANFSSLTDPAREAFRAAIAEWECIADLSFVELDESLGLVGTLRVGYTEHGMGASQLAYTYAPDGGSRGGDLWLNARLQADLFSDFSPGTLSSYIMLHELGHALGLKHPHEESLKNRAILSREMDTVFNSSMSYYAWPDIGLTPATIDRFPSGPMSLDIDAIQVLYGANDDSHTGDDVYTFDGNGKYLETIYDGGGQDLIRMTGNRPAEIDLHPDAWSRIGQPVQINGGAIQSADTVRIYRATRIENASGSAGNDMLKGNDDDNSLVGNGGNDTIEGGSGSDRLDGGEGKDSLLGGPGADTFILTSVGSGNVDRIRDFSEEDSLVFTTEIFPSLKNAQSDNLAFGRAHDSADHLIYKRSQGALFYDADGDGKEQAPIKIVLLAGPDARYLDFGDMEFL